MRGQPIPIQAPLLYVLKPKSPGAIVTVFAELLSMTGSEKMASLKLRFVRKFRTAPPMTGGGRGRPVGVGGDLDAHEIITVAEHHPIDADRVEPVEGAACTHGGAPRGLELGVAWGEGCVPGTGTV